MGSNNGSNWCQHHRQQKDCLKDQQSMASLRELHLAVKQEPRQQQRQHMLPASQTTKQSTLNEQHPTVTVLASMLRWQPLVGQMPLEETRCRSDASLGAHYPADCSAHSVADCAADCAADCVADLVAHCLSGLAVQSVHGVLP